LIQEQLCGFLLDDVMIPRGEFYAGLSSILSMGATTDEGTSEGPIRRPERGGGSEWEPIKILLEGD
jgi:hypothetical protein